MTWSVTHFASPPFPEPEELLRHTAWMRRLALGLLGDRAAAEDAVQQAWLRALEHPPRRPGAWAPWLRVITRNAALQDRRGDRRRQSREQEAPSARDPKDPAELAAKAEAHRAVVAELLRLEEPYRQTFLLLFFDGQTPKQVARELGITPDAVRLRLHRGLKKLRQRLQGKWGEEWQSCCLPLLGGTPPLLPGAGMAAAAVLLAGIGAWAVWWGAGGAPSPPLERGVVAAGVSAAPAALEEAGRGSSLAAAPGESGQRILLESSHGSTLEQLIQILGPDGLAAAGARVAVFAGEELLQSGTADAAGRLVLTGNVPPVQAQALVAVDGAVPELFALSTTALPEEALGLRFPPSPAVAGRVIWQGPPPPSRLSFTLCTDSPLVRVESAPQSAWDAIGWSHPLVKEVPVAVGPDGSFAYSGLPANWSGRLDLKDWGQRSWLVDPRLEPERPVRKGGSIVLLRPEAGLRIHARASSSIHGTVVDAATGGPAAGVEVTAMFRLRDTPRIFLRGSTRSSTTDAFGRFGFAVGQPGEYVLDILQGVSADGSSQFVQTWPGDPVPGDGNLGIHVLRPASWLRLTVLDTGGAPLAGARVLGMGRLSRPSGPDGVLLLDGLPDATGELDLASIAETGFLSPGASPDVATRADAWVVTAPGFQDGVLPFPAEGNVRSASQTIQLQPLRSWGVRLRRPSGEAVRGAIVRLRVPNWHRPAEGLDGARRPRLRMTGGSALVRGGGWPSDQGVYVTGMPDENGGCLYSGVEAGDRIVVEVLDLASEPVARRAFEIGETASDAPRKILLESARRIRGRLIDQTGQAVPGVSVGVTRLGRNGGRFALDRSDASGSFELGWCLLGGTPLHLWAPQHVDQLLLPSAFPADGSAATFQLTAKRSLLVRLRHRDGTPVDGMKVYAEAGGRQIERATAMGDGQYHLRGLPPHSFTLCAEIAGQVWRFQPEEGAAETGFELPDFGSIEVAIPEAARGRWPSRPRVVLERRVLFGDGHGWIGSPVVPGQGELRVLFETLPAGSYRVALHASIEKVEASKTVSLAEGQQLEIRFGED